MNGIKESQLCQKIAQNVIAHTGTELKKCSSCGMLKPLNLFYLRNKKPISRCKECIIKKAMLWAENNEERRKTNLKNYYLKNKDTFAEKGKRWAINNKEKVKESAHKYFIKNKEKIKIRRNIYLKNNRKKVNAKTNKYRSRNKDKVVLWTKNWKEKNPEKYRELQQKNDKKRGLTRKGNLRNRIVSGMCRSLKKGIKKGRHWETLVGYSCEQLEKHLEKNFLPGMSWENRSEWHIDHILPISKFNFEKPEDEDFKRCWELKNLRPLWAKENLIKHNSLIKPLQQSLIFYS